jgi:hypothetical protein
MVLSADQTEGLGGARRTGTFDGLGVTGMKSAAARDGMVASLDGIRYALTGLSAVGSICFFFVAVIDAIPSTPLRDAWLVSYVRHLSFALTERLSSWLNATWLLQFQQLSALLIAFLLLAAGIFANAGLRALSSQMIRARSR